jgi:hypothetical protein
MQNMLQATGHARQYPHGEPRVGWMGRNATRLCREETMTLNDKMAAQLPHYGGTGLFDVLLNLHAGLDEEQHGRWKDELVS